MSGYLAGVAHVEPAQVERRGLARCLGARGNLGPRVQRPLLGASYASAVDIRPLNGYHAHLPLGAHL